MTTRPREGAKVPNNHRPAEALTGACRSIVAEAIGQTGTAPRYARASFRVRIDGRVFEYAALLKLVGGAA